MIAPDSGSRMATTPPLIRGTKSAMVDAGRPRSYIAVGLLCLFVATVSECLESERGVILRNNDPVCGTDCDKFYLQIDSTHSTLYLRAYDFYPYAGKHVEVTGTRASCNGCIVLTVVNLTLLP